MSESGNVSLTAQSVLPADTAAALATSVQQLGSYLVQMSQIMMQMQARLDELEEKERTATLSHEEVRDVQRLIRLRADEYCLKYDLAVDLSCRTIGNAIRKAVLQRYGVKDLHDVPAIARQAVEAQISKWADIRTVMKYREKLAQGDGGA